MMLKKIQLGIKNFNQVIGTDSTFVYPADSKEYTGTLVFSVSDGISKATTVEQVFVPFSKNSLFDNVSFKQEYMILSDDILDDKKYQTFKTAIIGNIIGNKSIIGKGADNIDAVFDAYWLTVAKPVFLGENNITKSFIENIDWISSVINGMNG